MEQGLGNILENNTPEITNIDTITANTNYVLTRDGDNNLIAEEQEELPRNLNNVLANRRYQLTRTSGNVVPVEDTGITISQDGITENTGYIIRRNDGNYSLTRVSTLLEYNFEAEDVQLNAQFTIGGVNNSRIVHMINTDCRVVRFGVIHFSRESFVGFIDREYRYEIIINNVNNRNEIVVPGITRGNPISTTVDVEDLNLNLTRGGTMGLRYVSGNVGDFMHCTLTVDTNI